MKSLLLAGTALALSGPAFAADLAPVLPAKAPIAAAPDPFTWSSCYVGVHIGAGWDRTRFSDPGTGGVQNIEPAGDSIHVDGTGALGGGQVGCDQEFASHWVLGLAGDFSWANIEGETGDPFFGGKAGNPITLHSKTDFLGSVTGRIGYAVDHYLFYAKAGPAWEHDKDGAENLITMNGAFCVVGFTFVPCNPTATATRTGWVAGFGTEWAFAKNWSAFAEFDYYGFGSKTLQFSDPNSIGPISLSVKEDVEVAKVGLNYRFGWAGIPIGGQ